MVLFAILSSVTFGTSHVYFSVGWNRGATYALLATFFRGISFPLFKIVAAGIGAVPLSFILEARVTFTALDGSGWLVNAGIRLRTWSAPLTFDMTESWPPC